MTNTKSRKKQSPIEAVVRMASTINDDVIKLFKLFLDSEAEIECAFEAAIDVSELTLLKQVFEYCDNGCGTDWVTSLK